MYFVWSTICYMGAAIGIDTETGSALFHDCPSSEVSGMLLLVIANVVWMLRPMDDSDD